MANNVQQQQQQYPQPAAHSSPHHCKECGLYLNSAESLDVHLQYHKENLLNKWATQTTVTGGPAAHIAGVGAEETNNNTTPPTTTTTVSGGGKVHIKREFADSSDAPSSLMKKSPEYGSRATPEMNVSFGHPPTPQSYHSAASSPYQTPDNSAFSPGFSAFPVKAERASPNHFATAHQTYQNFGDHGQQQQQWMGSMDGSGGGVYHNHHLHHHQQQQQQQQQLDYMTKMGSHAGSYRCHPYQTHHGTHHQVSSSSPAYPPQPTPSPSPKQCDKCGYVCESASLLIEHLSVAHPPTPAPHYQQQQQQNNSFTIFEPMVVKTEETDAQSEILDLDSHKVVHQAYGDEAEKRVGELNAGGGGGGHNPHSVTAMLNSWQPPPPLPPPAPHQQTQNKLFGDSFASKFHEFNANEQTTGTVYRSFEHMSQQQPQATPPLISSTQVPSTPPSAPPTTAKGTNWKSNEARRPKTYNCTACNKWFTSSGHLKRHYNTTLHKNAVKSSGQPDPATMPISVHHHPARDNSANRDDASRASPEEIPGGRVGTEDVCGGLQQQQPAGPYDRLQSAPNLIHHPLSSPPNGEAGLSASITTNIHSRGLLSISNSASNSSNSTSDSSNSNPHGFNPPPQHMMMAAAGPMDSHQFQMYPNECAPHVTQVTAATTNSHNTTGEFINSQQQQQAEMGGGGQQVILYPQQPSLSTAVFTPIDVSHQSQALPSFSQLNNHRYGLLLGYNVANVGGSGSVTVPYATFYPNTTVDHQAPPQPAPSNTATNEDDGYKLTVLTTTTTTTATPMGTYGDIERKTNTVEDVKDSFEQPASPEKAHIKRDYEESTGSPRITSTSVAQISKGTLHKCYDCDKLFNKSCYLTQHNKTFHSGDKPFKCTRCGKRFSDEDGYQEHLNKHAGDKPHKCELCPKQFNHKTDLRRHMCLHTGQKPYVCDTCGKGFIRKDHMVKHCETHNKQKGNKGARHSATGGGAGGSAARHPQAIQVRGGA